VVLRGVVVVVVGGVLCGIGGFVTGPRPGVGSPCAIGWSGVVVVVVGGALDVVVVVGPAGGVDCT
jgi:hypothetical protein